MSYKCCTIGNRLSLQLALSMLNEFETSKTIILVLLHPIMFITALIFLDLTKSQTALSTLFSLPVTPDHFLPSFLLTTSQAHSPQAHVNDIRTHDFFMKHSFFSTAHVWNTRFLSNDFFPCTDSMKLNILPHPISSCLPFRKLNRHIDFALLNWDSLKLIFHSNIHLGSYELNMWHTISHF